MGMKIEEPMSLSPEAQKAAVDALLGMRGFVAMFHGRLTEIDSALEMAGHPQPPVENVGPPAQGNHSVQ